VVVGGLGVIGRALIDHLTGDPGWDGSRAVATGPDFETTARFLSVDLREKDSSKAALAQLKKTTHVFYAAYQPMPTRTLEVDANLASLSTLWRRSVRASSSLGSQPYGGGSGTAPIGPIRTPALER